ncbi:MAG: hypothetical protein JXA14_25345 [Anaerolineae bacterium]|nr:hypothetical protein [Anaerolineae bacterium]
MGSRETKRVVFTCENCGYEQAVKIIEYWTEKVTVTRPTAYFGEHPEEYGEYPDTFTGQHHYREVEETVFRERVVRTECPKCKKSC